MALPSRDKANLAPQAGSISDELDLDALPTQDNTEAGLRKLLGINAAYRKRPWPAPFDVTHHILRMGDARDLSWLPSGSVHLVVTSPPYWILKQYKQGCPDQLGDIQDYERFLDELDKTKYGMSVRAYWFLADGFAA